MILCIDESKTANPSFYDLTILLVMIILLVVTVNKIINIFSVKGEERKNVILKSIPWFVGFILSVVLYYLDYKREDDLFGLPMIILFFMSFIEIIYFIIKTVMSDKKDRKRFFARLVVWIAIFAICAAIYVIFYVSQGNPDGPWATTWCR